MSGRPCGVTDCQRPHHSHGYCVMHMHRWLKHGDPTEGGRIDADARLEDLRWMADTGEGLSGASARIGAKVKTVEAFLRRHDPDCLARLIAHEPKDHNRLRDGVSIYDLTGLGDRVRRRKANRAREESAA